MIKLREYQQDCINKILSMSKGEKKIACLPTGSGKTILMAELCRQINSRVLIIVFNTELRTQTIDKLKMVCGNNVDVGSVQGNLKEWDNKIVVATRQTLTSGKDVKCRFIRLLQEGNFSHVLIDECHTGSKQQKTIIDNVNKDATIVGFTATPFNSALTGLYDGFIYKRELLDMMKDKYLVEPVCYTVKSNIDLNDVKVVRGDFSDRELSNKIDNEYRNNLIVKSYIEKCKTDNRNKTIVFCTTIEHSKNVAECFIEHGIKAISIDGTVKKKDREQILKDFHEGKYEVICNCMILTIGFDEPSIDSVIFARPTKSKSLFIQCLGRGLRLSPNKKDCLVLDVVDVVTKHDIVSTKTIFDTVDGETPLQAIERKDKEEAQQKIIDATEEKRKNFINENNFVFKYEKEPEEVNIDQLITEYKEENLLIERDIEEKKGKKSNNKVDKVDNCVKKNKGFFNKIFSKLFA
ncbi:DEAD/DEAH box helicase [Clostridium butyricum]|uniref:DEAD/DEAH box helicase n=1 Tax=Clostridium butyricum TaxID=1492 RepID=UPI00325A6CF4